MADGPLPGPDRQAYDLQSGVVDLRPLHFTDVLDGSFTLYRKGIRTLVALVLAVHVPVQLLAAFLQREALSTGPVGLFDDPTGAQVLFGEGGVTAGLVISVLVQVLVTPLLAGALAHACAQVVRGRPASLRTSAAAALRRGGWLVGAYVVLGLARVALLGLAGLAVLADLGGVVVLLVLLGVLVAMALTPLFAVVTPAIVLEDRSGADAIVHGIRLARRAYGRTVGVVVGTTFVFTLLAFLLAGIPNALGLLAGIGFGWVLVAGANILSTLITAPLTAAAMVLLHTDLRVRQEGFDFDLLLARLRSGAPA